MSKGLLREALGWGTLRPPAESMVDYQTFTLSQWTFTSESSRATGWAKILSEEKIVEIDSCYLFARSKLNKVPGISNQAR